MFLHYKVDRFSPGKRYTIPDKNYNIHTFICCEVLKCEVFRKIETGLPSGKNAEGFWLYGVVVELNRS